MRDFPNSYPKPDWLPDWKDSKQYEDHENYSHDWAWECLRRNPAYQEDYARWASNTDTDEDGSLSPKYSTHGGDWVPMAFCHDDPPAINDAETMGEYEQRTGIWPDLLQNYICYKWGLISPCDPAGNGSDVMWDIEFPFRAPYELKCFKAQLMNYPIMKRGEEGVGKQVMARVMLELGREEDPRTKGFDHHLESEDYLLLAFDLRDDPKRQVDEALDLIRRRRQEWQKKKKEAGGPQLSKMIQRLRVFDAVWTLGDGKQAHIGQEIFGRNADATVSNDLKIAKQLILEGGYRALLRMD